MGEVYRAYDTRLRRNVALKVLPATFTNDPERLRRFEQEARAVAALNHPNILSVYDVGKEGDVHYLVSELLEGSTLREQIPATGMGVRKATELAVQLANGLAAAHDQNVVHRDLKPENIFVTKNGHVKILDFGLAKLRRVEAHTETVDGISLAETNAGQVLGTVGYMSPEQVKGEPADHRSDIFSFGSILYEMLTGQRAFKKNTGAETMTAILNEEPADFSMKSGAIAPALERIVRHCLEKVPGKRFQSAHDIAFDLESMSGISSTSGTAAAAVKSTSRKWMVPAAVAGVVLLGAGLGLGAWLRPKEEATHVKLHRITFRRGTIWAARFTPEGNLVYAASWEGNPVDIHLAQKGNTESRPLGLPSAQLLAVSKGGDLAITVGPKPAEGFTLIGMLAKSPLGGGAPRELLDKVEFADWGPDGNSLAVVRRVSGKVRLEYPLGKVLYEPAGWISHPRISPDGKLLAFLDHPFENDDTGFVVVIDQEGKRTTLTRQYVSAQGLVWNEPTNEIWYTATTSGSNRELWAVSLDKRERLVYPGTGTLTVYDIAKDGRVLFTRDDLRGGIYGLAPGETKERELSWHDYTGGRDLSDDGRIVSFDETGEAGGATGGMYVRRTNGDAAVKLGDGLTPTLSGDGKKVLAMVPNSAGKRVLMEFPTGAGESRTVPTGDVQALGGYFFPDGQHILVYGNAAGDHGSRLWVFDGKGGTPRAISPEGSGFRTRTCISPDGTKVVGVDPEGNLTIYPVDGGEAKPVPGIVEGDRCVRWTEDGKSLLVTQRDVPNVVYMVDLASKQRKEFKRVAMPDVAGLQDYGAPLFSKDLKSYVYGYSRATSDLYVADGLK